MLRLLGRCAFSKLTREAVMGASYDELANLIVKQYGNPHFRNSNSLALYQIQHHFKVISKGDCVLDLGAGPDYNWTDLALTLAQNEDSTHKVISSDLLSLTKPRSNNLFVRGDFHEEQVRAQIGAGLGGRKFNSILVDVSPEYTGDLQADGLEINQLVFQALYFSNLFLEKGGNFICKVLACESTKVLEDNAKIFFHKAESFRPSVLRERSPVQFLIMRGFAINPELEAMREFLSRYRGGTKSKIDLVREYQGKYRWDPLQVLRNRAKSDIMLLKMQGKADKEIENMFLNDPHIRPAEILKQIRAIDKAHANADQTQLDKAVYQFTDGKLSGEGSKVPNTREEWVAFLETVEARMKQAKNKKKGKVEKVRRNLQPLGENEVYMKDHLQSEEEPTPPIYIEADLLGQYEQEQEKKYLQRELLKMKENYPDQEKKVEEWRKKHGQNKPINLEEVFGRQAEREEAATSMEEDIHQLGDTLKAITDEQYKEIIDKQRYYQEREQFTSENKANDRTKFRNR